MVPAQFSNKAVAHLLRSVAAVYLLKNEDRFRIMAYEKAADAVEKLNREIHDIWQEGKLNKVPGVGPSLFSHINELFTTGKSTHFDQTLQGIPESVFVLMDVPSLGPKKAFKLVQALKLIDPKTILQDVKKAAMGGEIAVIPTFGDKSQQDILEAIERYEKHSGETRIPLADASERANAVIEYLSKHPAVKHLDALGSLRRKVATIGDIDIAAIVDEKDVGDVIAYFTKYPGVVDVDNAGGKKASIIITPNIRVDLRVQTLDNYGSMLQYFTGSKAHNIQLREFALRKGLSLSEWGIKQVNRDRHPEGTPEGTHITDSGAKRSFAPVTQSLGISKQFKTEEEFYGYLGLPYIPPEIREGTNEIELAKQNKLPKLVELADIKGDFHIHSSYDLKPSHDLGQNSYPEIMQHAIELGYEYVGFADHNPKMSGLSTDQIVHIMKVRREYIDELFSSSAKKILSYFVGLEVDILPTGEIALPAKAIHYVDYLIVSVHSVFDLNMDRQTERVIRALSYPKVRIFGHPTGRLLGKRAGIDLDWDKIFSYVANKNIALEINAGTPRLDLPDMLVREGLAYGVKYFINTDAHAVEAMDSMEYGVSVARRGWLERKSVVNTWSGEEMKKFMETRN